MEALLIAVVLCMQPVTLSGDVVEQTPGKFELVVKDVGRYDLKGYSVPGKDITIIGDYFDGGTIEAKLALTSIEQSMIKEANVYRKRAGLKLLVPDSMLMTTARQHSSNMARRRSMYHGGTSGWSGENVAWNQPTPAAVTLTWYNSPGHRRNMLNPHFTKIGVGSVNRYWTQQFK